MSIRASERLQPTYSLEVDSESVYLKLETMWSYPLLTAEIQAGINCNTFKSLFGVETKI